MCSAAHVFDPPADVKSIDEHLFLSDLRTAALVDSSGAITWLCAPRFDGVPLFGALVGGPGGGHFRVCGEQPGRQEYLGNTLIGRTHFGKVSVTDFLDCSGGRTAQRAGRSDLLRIIEGSGSVCVEFAPKFNFGRVPTRLSGIPDGLRIDCGQLLLVLASPGWQWEVKREGMHDVAHCERVINGERLSLRLLIGTASSVMPARSVEEMLAGTSRFWEESLSTLKIPRAHQSLIARGALVLRGLSYGPTGAIIAAPTTSLPENITGVRNWDYRYCWPRDACLAASSLMRLGDASPAMRLLDWMLGIMLDIQEERFIAPLYTVTGGSVPAEAEVPEASGYRGSRPVRLGNLASEQLQLDSVGPIAELMVKLARRGVFLTSEHLQLSEWLVRMIDSRWNDPDSGIWEVRGAQRHYVHSKLMCWYAVSCCSEVSGYLGVKRENWDRLAQTIRLQIETEGFDSELNSYVSAYDLHCADAALLWVILSGFHPPEHPRSLGTLNYILQNLARDGAVKRYHFDDTLAGAEGEFVLCRAWLIEALAMAGRKAEARRLLKEFEARIAPLGLLAEQWDIAHNLPLGNYPQAYSHLGLINAVCALNDGEPPHSIWLRLGHLLRLQSAGRILVKVFSRLRAVKK